MWGLKLSLTPRSQLTTNIPLNHWVCLAQTWGLQGEGAGWWLVMVREERMSSLPIYSWEEWCIWSSGMKLSDFQLNYLFNQSSPCTRLKYLCPRTSNNNRAPLSQPLGLRASAQGHPLLTISGFSCAKVAKGGLSFLPHIQIVFPPSLFC